jgi:hypothetical protein
MNTPRFRAVSKVIDSGLVHYPAAEFELRDWPNVDSGEMVALNIEAQRLLAYQRENRNVRGFPARLMRNDGSIFLPAYPGHHFDWRCPPPVEAKPKPDMPTYRVQGRAVLGGVEHRNGIVVAYLGWPAGTGLLPVNEIAKAIVAYEAAYGDQLLHSPWCRLRAGPYLPLPLNGVDLAETLKPYRAAVALPRKTRAHRHRARGTQPRLSA